jgi:transcriptional regulator with XRE-family HTH domain
MRVEEAIGRQIARLRAQRQWSLTDLGEALGHYLDRPWSRQAVHQAERGQRSFTAAELTALALVLDTSVQTLFRVEFRADNDQIDLPSRAVSPEEYRGILLSRDRDAPLDGVEEMIVALHDIGEVLSRPALARLARIGRAAEQVAGP